MLKKEVAEPDENFCEDNEGGHSESIAIPEEAATDMTVALELPDDADSHQHKVAENEASSSSPDPAALNDKLSGESSRDEPAEMRHDSRREDGREDNQALEEPLLANSHQVRNAL